MDVDTYKQSFRVQKTGAVKVIEGFGHMIKWKNHMNILEVGCGEGSTTVNILKPLIERNVTSYKLTAIDVSEAMIKSANETFPDEKDVAFELMDIADDNLKSQYEQRFDLIMSFFCLHFVPNYNNWIRNVSNMVNSNGQIFLITTGKCIVSNLFQEMKEGAKWSSYLQGVSFLDSPLFLSSEGRFLIREKLKTGGFRNVFHEAFDHDTILSEKSYLRNFLKAFSGLYETIPKSLVDEFLDEIAEKTFQACSKLSNSDYCLRLPLYVFIADK